MARLRRAKDAQNDFFPGFSDISEIGIGSLATVYRAREVGTNRSVALKLLNVRDASPRAIESFERESVALGAVSSHPNIVTLYRSFRAADGRPVLVLELCRGSIGDTMVDGQGLPVADVIAMGVKVAGALETAHRAQILHRDVKPQNILITEFGEPALADFGVAMLQSSTQTTAGLFDFTTLHAAPELLEGGETSAATDVYELASSLYQLVAGKSAFRAYDGESPASVILRILRDPVQPLSNVQVPGQLSDLLLNAMSKDKSDRPPTAAEFAAELSAVEVAQGWPRTPFLIRDPDGSAVGLPNITRMPQLRTKGAPPVGMPPSAGAAASATGPGTAPSWAQQAPEPPPAWAGWAAPPQDQPDQDQPWESAPAESPVPAQTPVQQTPAQSAGAAPGSFVSPAPSAVPPPFAASAPPADAASQAAAVPPRPEPSWAPPPRPSTPDQFVTPPPAATPPPTDVAPPADGPSPAVPPEPVAADDGWTTTVLSEHQDDESDVPPVEAATPAVGSVPPPAQAETSVPHDDPAAPPPPAPTAADREPVRIDDDDWSTPRMVVAHDEPTPSSAEPEPVVAAEPEPEPVVEAEPMPEPVVEAEPMPEPVVEAEPMPEPVVEAEPIPEPAADPEPEPAAAAASESVAEAEPEWPPAVIHSAESPSVASEPGRAVEPEAAPRPVPVHEPAPVQEPEPEWPPATIQPAASAPEAPEPVAPAPADIAPPMPSFTTAVAATSDPHFPSITDEADALARQDLDEYHPPVAPQETSHPVAPSASVEPPPVMPSARVEPSAPVEPPPVEQPRVLAADYSEPNLAEPPVPGASVFPIPPTRRETDLAELIENSPPSGGTTEVPTWAFRAPSTTGLVQLPAGGFGASGGGGQSGPGDLTLDPMSLRRRVTLRSGMRALIVDDQRLVLRSWWKRSEIPWSQIHGVELRFDNVEGGGSSGGRIVAMTSNGPVDLPATNRTLADLRYVHALLDAYRIRAQMLANR